MAPFKPEIQVGIGPVIAPGEGAEDKQVDAARMVFLTERA